MTFRIFRQTPAYNFMGRRWLGFSVSIALTLLSLGIVFTKGLNLGIDFTGGVLMEIRTEKKPDLHGMRKLLSAQDFGEVSLQDSGDGRDVIIRIQTKGNEQQAVVASARDLLKDKFGKVDFRKIDYVGPTVGRELLRDGTLAVLLSLGVIMFYVWFRFEWQYGLGAVLALMHDAIMMVGFFAFTRLEFGLTSLAAILTIVGYSINDTVVIYDRIRENMRRFKKMSVFDLLNLSINETLSRTFLTASTVLLSSLALALWGGEVLKGFSWAMVFGVIVGTYSSIYISAPALIYLNIRPAEAEPEPAHGTA
jgi:preprotein translocase SecF subunit